MTFLFLLCISISFLILGVKGIVIPPTPSNDPDHNYLSDLIHDSAHNNQHAWSAPSLQQSNNTQFGPHNIAVIGAGAAGSSFAYYISKAFPLAQIDVYESSNRIGGRCMSEKLTISKSLNLAVSVESGASMFVDENQNLMRAAREFQLHLTGHQNRTGKRDNPQNQHQYITIWNGNHSVYDTEVDMGLRSGFRNFKRYRFGPIITRHLANEVSTKLSKIYEPNHPSYSSWSNLVDGLDLRPETRISARDYASVHYINELFVNEVIEGLTRTNYGRNLDQVHSLAALVGHVKGAMHQVVGGIQRIFEQFIKRSNANINFNTKVHAIFVNEQTGNTTSLGGYKLMVSSGEDSVPRNITESYDLVVVGVPYPAMASIKIPFITTQIPKVPYHHIYATYVLGKLNLTTFPIDPVQVLTTNSVKHVQSISQICDFSGILDRGLKLFKVFSTVPIHEDQNVYLLSLLFESVRKTWPREWLSYPIMQPEPQSYIKQLGDDKYEEFYPPLVLHRSVPKLLGTGGVFYLNGIERFLSTMETATIASRNLVRLLVDEISTSPERE